MASAAWIRAVGTHTHKFPARLLKHLVTSSVGRPAGAAAAAAAAVPELPLLPLQLGGLLLQLLLLPQQVGLARSRVCLTEGTRRQRRS